MAQILQIKRTNDAVVNSAEPLAQFGSNENPQTIAQGEMFYANAGVTGLAGTEEGVLYIGTELTAGNAADAIGGKAFTKMLSPKQYDTATVITQAGSDGDNTGDAAKLTLADGQKTSLQKTMSIAAPDEVTADDTVLLPQSPGSNSTTADTIITTDGSGEVGALTSSATITGLTLATANASINNAGTVTATSVDSSGTIDGTTITGTTLATANASISDAGAIAGASVDVSGEVEAASVNVTADGNTSLASIGTDGATTVASLNAGSGTIQTTGTLSGGATDVDSLSVSNGGITNAGNITGATSITASGKISGAELEISGDMIVANTTDITIEDNLLQVASTATGSNTTNQSGWYAKVNDGSDGLRYAGMVYDNADAKFKVLQDDTNAPTTSFTDATQATGTLVANVEGTVSTSGTVTAGAVSTASVTSATDITLDPAGNDVIVSIGGHSVTIDENGITASSGSGMSLDGFITDGGVL